MFFLVINGRVVYAENKHKQENRNGFNCPQSFSGRFCRS